MTPFGLEKFFIRRKEIPDEEASDSVDKYTPSPQEAVLALDKIVDSSQLKGGATIISLVSIENDGLAVLKEKGALNERAAYIFDRFLGFDLVPPTSLRETGEGEERDVRSIQSFIEESKTGFELVDLNKKPPSSYIERYEFIAKLTDQWDEVIKIALLDLIILNSDRHPGNWVVADGKIYAIDHHLAFGMGVSLWFPVSQKGELTILTKKSISKNIIDNLRNLVESEEKLKLLKDMLVGLMTEDEIVFYVNRIAEVFYAIDQNGEISEEALSKLCDIKV